MGKDPKKDTDLDKIIGISLDNFSKNITESLVDIVSISAADDTKTPLTEETSPTKKEHTVQDYGDKLKELGKKTDREYILENDLLGNTDEKVTQDQLKVANADLWKKVQVSLASLGGGGVGMVDVQEEVDKKIEFAFDTGLYTTDNLDEGDLSLYFTEGRVQSIIDSWLPTITSDSVTEGTTNLYFRKPVFDAYFDSAWDATFQSSFDQALLNDSSVIKEPILNSKGIIDATTTSAPAAEHGDLYANFVDGFIDSGWGVISGDSVLNGNFLIYDSNAVSGEEWRKFQGINGTVLLQEGVDSQQVIDVIADQDVYMAHDGGAIAAFQARGKRISGLGYPAGINDAASKQYVDIAVSQGGGGGGGSITPATELVLGGVKIKKNETNYPLRMDNLNNLTIMQARSALDDGGGQKGIASFSTTDFVVDNGFVSLRRSDANGPELNDYRGVAVVAQNQSEAQIGGLYFANGHLYVRR